MILYPIIDNQVAVLRTQIASKKTGWKYGRRIHPITGEVAQWHNGIDLKIAEGSKIYAPLDGIVIKIWSDAINGLGLRIQHYTQTTIAAGVPAIGETGYAHLSRYADGIVMGTKVRAGDIVAYSGNTGRSTGPHLHFVAREIVDKMRIEVDPLPYLMGQEF